MSGIFVSEYPPSCGKCQSEMEQLPGFMTFFCPSCSSQTDAIAFLRASNENPEIEIELRAIEQQHGNTVPK